MLAHLQQLMASQQAVSLNKMQSANTPTAVWQQFLVNQQIQQQQLQQLLQVHASGQEADT